MIPPVVRRVVTGQKENGESLFTHVEEIEPLRRDDGTVHWWGVWGFDETPTLPYYNAAPYVPRSLFPTSDGKSVRIQMSNLPPGTGVLGRTPASQSAEWRRLRDAQDHGLDMMDEVTGMHSTDTIDIGVVISGECELEQGNGDTVTLRVGDVYIQNGAEHAWHNRTDQAFIILCVFLGVPRREGPSEASHS